MLQRLYRHGFHDTRPVPEGYSRLIVDSTGRPAFLGSDGTASVISTVQDSGSPTDYLTAALAPSAATALTTATAKTVTSLTLTAGIWEVEGQVTIVGAASTTTARSAAVHSATDALPAAANIIHSGAQTTTANHTTSIVVPRRRLSVASGQTVTYYLVASATFSAGTMTAWGDLRAKRIA